MRPNPIHRRTRKRIVVGIAVGSYFIVNAAFDGLEPGLKFISDAIFDDDDQHTT